MENHYRARQRACVTACMLRFLESDGEQARIIARDIAQWSDELIEEHFIIDAGWAKCFPYIEDIRIEFGF
jgi:hypothetical protein